MRTRDKGFKDYDFKSGEEKQLKKYCRGPDFGECDMLKQSAILSNPLLSEELYESIVEGVSYDKMSTTKDLHISKNDFYGYQRKCLWIFKNLLRQQGKWH